MKVSIHSKIVSSSIDEKNLNGIYDLKHKVLFFLDGNVHFRIDFSNNLLYRESDDYVIEIPIFMNEQSLKVKIKGKDVFTVIPICVNKIDITDDSFLFQYVLTDTKENVSYDVNWRRL